MSRSKRRHRPGGSPSPETAALAPSPGCECVRPTHEQVAERAHEIWLRKGQPQGQDLEIWLAAETELSPPDAHSPDTR